MVINTAALLLTLVGFGIFVSLYGHDPMEVFYVLYLGAFATQISIESTLTQAAPLMLTALCTALPARAGLLVIGGEGALVIGGVATVLVGVHLGGLPFALGVAIMGLAGALAGGLWIGAAGALRVPEIGLHRALQVVPGVHVQDLFPAGLDPGMNVGVLHR